MTHIQIDNVYIRILLKNNILVIIHLEVKVDKNFMKKTTQIENCKLTLKNEIILTDKKSYNGL